MHYAKKKKKYNFEKGKIIYCYCFFRGGVPRSLFALVCHF